MADINPLRYRGYYYDTETGFYYLQSRYYDPATHRFINVDSYASTGQGFIGTNMFTYCNNNPINLFDPCGNMAGKFCTTYINDGGGRPSTSKLRDVTAEVNDALKEEIIITRSLYHKFLDDYEQYKYVLLFIFYKKVHSNGPWDIKLEQPWIATIGTEYPGYEAEVIYSGHVMTLEDLGKYTYGCLGRAFGFDLYTLYWGLEYAANFPAYGT